MNTASSLVNFKNMIHFKAKQFDDELKFIAEELKSADINYEN